MSGNEVSQNEVSPKEVLSILIKNFNSLPEEQQKKAFLSAIDFIKNNDKFQNAKKYWDELDEEHKFKYYKDGGGSWKFLTTGPLTPRFHKDGIKIDLKDNIYTVMSPVMRLFVSFGILDKPKDLSYEDLINNIKIDVKKIKRYIVILQIASVYYPELGKLLDILKYLEPLAKWYKDHGAQIIQERIRDKQTRETQSGIAETLSALNDNQSGSSGTEKKAA